MGKKIKLQKSFFLSSVGLAENNFKKQWEYQEGTIPALKKTCFLSEFYQITLYFPRSD